MHFSRHILMVLAFFGLAVRVAPAAGPEPQLPTLPAVSEEVKMPPAAEPPAKESPAEPPKQPSPPMTSAPLPAPAVSSHSNPWCESCPCLNCPCDWCETHCGGFVGGVGLYVLQPYFSNNMAFGIQGTFNRGAAANAPGVRFDTREEISHHMEAAPEIWLGYISEGGLGARARWWYFREGTDQMATGDGNGIMVFSAAPLGLSFLNAGQANPGGAGVMEVTSKLEVQVEDFEAVYDLKACGWDLLLAGGLQLTWIDQTYNAFVPRSGNNVLLSSNTFDGIGPTLALEARRPFGDTGLKLIAKARGSMVFGSGHQIALVPDQNVVANEHRDTSISIGEAELGVEYGLSMGRSRLFGQLTFVGQQWFGAGSASRSSVNVIPGGGFVGAANTTDSDITFLGLAIRLGMNY